MIHYTDINYAMGANKVPASFENDNDNDIVLRVLLPALSNLSVLKERRPHGKRFHLS